MRERMNERMYTMTKHYTTLQSGKNMKIHILHNHTDNVSLMSLKNRGISSQYLTVIAAIVSFSDTMLQGDQKVLPTKILKFY